MLLIQEDAVRHKAYTVRLRLETTDEESWLQITLRKTFPGYERDGPKVVGVRKIPTSQLESVINFLRENAGEEYQELNRLAWKLLLAFLRNDRIVRELQKSDQILHEV